MSEWKEEKLDSLVVVDPEQLSSSIDDDFTFFYIDISSVSEGHIDYPASQIKFKGSPSRARKNLKPNDVLMSTVRPNLKSFAKFKRESKFNFVASTGFAVLRAKQETDIDFIYQSLFFEKIERQIQTLVVGSNYPAINSRDVRKLLFDVPNFITQRKISRILSTADAVIEKTQAAIAKYKAVKQGMLHDLFTRGIDTANNVLRPTYKDSLELYKRSRLGWIPKEWEVVKIAEVSSLVTNGFVGIATPYYTTSDKGVPYLYGTNIREDFIEFDDLRYISREFHGNHSKSQLKNGDMLCVQSGHIGTCACVPDNLGAANCHALIITRFFKELIHPEFISFYLNSSIGKHELDKIIIGSTVKHINTSDLANHSVIKPSFTEQKEISERLKIIIRNIQTEQAYLKKLQHIKAGLMADLLSGKKKVNVKECVQGQ